MTRNAETLAQFGQGGVGLLADQRAESLNGVGIEFGDRAARVGLWLN